MSKGYIRDMLDAIVERDPAARNRFEVFMLYSGVHAIIWYRIAHWLHGHKMLFLARLFSQWGRFWTGVEIHPGAEIGRRVFIDHGSGVVIGETTVIGDDCTIYQGVTLGGTGKDVGKRHPTLGKNVMVGSGARVLGPFTVGDNSKIAANAVVLDEIPPNSTCVGVPARVVKQNDIRINLNMDQIHIPDPVSMEFCKLSVRIEHLEEMLAKTEKCSAKHEKETEHENL